MTNVILSQRSLLLAKIETTNNVENVPSPTADAFLVMGADVKLNSNVLTRDFYRPSLSRLPGFVGRKLATLTFTHEIKGRGNVSAPSKLGTLLRACGFAQTQIANLTTNVLSAVQADGLNSGPAITWAKTTNASGGYGRYKMKVVLGGASASAKMMAFGSPADAPDNTIFPEDVLDAFVMGSGATTTITINKTDPLAPVLTVGNPKIGDVVSLNIYGVRFKYTIGSAVAATEATAIAALLDPDPRMAAVAATTNVNITITGGVTGALTSGTTAVTLGASLAQYTPTWTGSLILGDSFYVDLLKPGYHYTPISNGFESMTMYMYYDGMLHRLTGCMGNVSFTGPAGQYATAQFTFTGQYISPDDAALPTNAIFETSIPVQVELAKCALGNSLNIRAQSFNIDMGVQIQTRDSVSHPDGYDGVRYTGREPKGGVNPEVSLESEEPMWRHMSVADILRFHARIGTVPGNIVEFDSNFVQLSNVGYTDRNTQRVYDLSMNFVTPNFSGDDELRIVFC